MNIKDLKKDDIILSKQLGTPIKGKLLESPKQGRGIKKVILIYAYGEDIGMFNEHGSINISDVVAVKRDNRWININNNN
jgi:hypothetical protein|tara:strand:+ start:541 stop:777 length:237 start_codon:yes stop_codon:yes gene_type:complete